jgi:hypothetical protein
MDREDVDVLIAMEDWNEFYRTARRAFSPFDLVELVIRRIAVETGLSDVHRRKLWALLKNEHEAIAREMLTRYGRDTLLSLFEVQADRPELLQNLWTGLRSIGDDVRRSFDDEFSAGFTPTQMSLINIHLRNSSYILCSGMVAREEDQTGAMLVVHDQNLRLVGVGDSRYGRGSGYCKHGDWTFNWICMPAFSPEK